MVPGITDIENHKLATCASIMVATNCSISLSSWSANNFARAAAAPRAVAMAALIRSVNGMSSFGHLTSISARVSSD